MYSPLEQFRNQTLIKIYNDYLDISINKTTIYIIISILIIIILFNIESNKIINNNYKRIIEIIYLEWSKQIKEIIGNEGKKYVIFIQSLFWFILINNLIGQVPYSYSITSQIIITFTMSITIILGVTFTGILKHNFNFIKLFIPSGIPTYLIPLLFIIELISYIFRIVSLAVRLTGNIVAGHTTIKIISNLGIKMTHLSNLLLIIPILFIFLLMGLEIGVAIIQSYVFSILTTSYIKDAEHLH